MNTESISAAELLEDLQHFDIQAGKAAATMDLGRLLESADDCSIIKRNARRQVYRIQAGGRRFFLKRATVGRVKDRFRLALLPNRKKAEWRNLHRLAAMGVAVPDPLFRGEAWHLKPPQFFLLTSEVAGRAVAPIDHQQWRQLGGFIAFLHGRGVYHADLHPGNIRLTAGGDHALLDVQSVFFLKRLPQFLKVRNIGRFSLHFLYPGGSSAWLQPFLEGYHAGGAAQIQIEEVLSSAERQLERRYRSRTRRCLTDSSEFERVADPDLKGFRRRGFDWGRSRLKTAIRQGVPLKSGTVFAYRGVCIKHRRRRMFHRDRCRKSWIMSRALEVRGIEVPRSMAYFRSGRQTYFLSEYIEGGQLLNDFLSGLTDTAQKRRALEALAHWIRRLHASRVRQRDLKSSNILRQNDRYLMLDMDSVTAKPPGSAQKIMNLAQLNASVSNAVTLKDRLRFFYLYTSGENWTRDRRRAAYRRIWEISSGKNTAIYDLDLDELVKACGM